MPTNILIIDDEAPIRFALRGILEDEGYTVQEAASAEEGIDGLTQIMPDLVFLDIWLPKMDGLQALESIHAEYPSLPVVMISGHGTIENAVTALRKGAYDSIEKPLSLEKIVIVAYRALETKRLRQENTALRSTQVPQDELLGTSQVMNTFKALLAKVAPTEAWVLLTGENGTGKELATRALHAQSHRSEQPWIAVNCAAIPEELIESELFGHEKGAFTGANASRIGRFEMADNGTLFLDEIGDMSLNTQAKILRILQEQTFERVGGTRSIHVNVRVIAATNKNLDDALAAGTFRKDLYYRLRVIPLHLPPLRDREGDIRLLTHAFITRLATMYGLRPPLLSDDAFLCLESYQWPGNVRELHNFCERIVILHEGKTIQRADLPREMYPQGSDQNQSLPEAKPEVNSEQALANTKHDTLLQNIINEPDFRQACAVFEQIFLKEKLREAQGNITQLAKNIGLERSYVHRKLKSYNIQ